MITKNEIKIKIEESKTTCVGVKRYGGKRGSIISFSSETQMGISFLEDI